MRPLTLRQQHQLLCLTAASGCLANLQLAAAKVRCGLTAEVFQAAAAAGDLDACEWLRQQGCPWGAALSAAAGSGHQAVCCWLLDCGCPWDDAAPREAVRGGHAGLLELLLMHRPEADGSRDPSLRLLAAAQGCDLATLQQLHQALLSPAVADGPQPPPPRTEHQAQEPQPPQQQQQQQQPQRQQQRSPPLPGGFPRALLAAAAASATPDWRAKVEWLERSGYPPTAAACCAVAALPDALERLSWLRRRGYPLDNSAAAEAAKAGRLEALQYLLAEGLRPARHVSAAAARGGHVDMLAALRAAGCPIDPGATTVAAYEGHLPVAVWLVEALGGSAQMDLMVMDSAAYGGSVALLAWLRGRGCPWGESTFSAAAEAGCEAALEWLAESGCPMGGPGRPYVHAYDNRDTATMRCLRRLGCPWCPLGSTFNRCLEGIPHLPSLRWLLEAGCPVDWDAALAVAARRVREEGGEEVLRWLQEQRRAQRKAGRRGVGGHIAAFAAGLACWPRLAEVGH